MLCGPILCSQVSRIHNEQYLLHIASCIKRNPIFCQFVDLQTSVNLSEVNSQLICLFFLRFTWIKEPEDGTKVHDKTLLAVRSGYSKRKLRILSISIKQSSIALRRVSIVVFLHVEAMKKNPSTDTFLEKRTCHFQ